MECPSAQSSASRKLLSHEQPPAVASPTEGSAGLGLRKLLLTPKPLSSVVEGSVVWHQVASLPPLFVRGNLPLASEPGPTSHTSYFPGGLGTVTNWLRSEFRVEIPDM